MSTPKWDPERFGRCENCGGKLVPDTKWDQHLGHRLHDVHRVSLWEWLRILVGAL